MLPRILIVSTTPYSTNSQSRATDTYFHDWPRENLRQIFSNSQKPMKGHCSSLYQICDIELISKIFHRKKKIGKIFNYDELSENPPDYSKDVLRRFKKRNWLRYYIRKKLWKRSRWLSEELCEWVEKFKPEIIYCGLSDDYFILDISYYFSQKYNIPIVIGIGDDYYFLKRHNIFVKPYFKSYKKLFDKIMNTDGFAVYISDKISKKYNSEFIKQGFPIYLSSNIKFKETKIKYEFNYFGNLELGRDKTLEFLGDLLFEIDSNFILNVYAPSASSAVIKHLTNHHCKFFGPIPYSSVENIMNCGSFNIVASGFQKKYVEAAKYSLSTKVSDALAASGPIIAVGPEGDGAIDYLLERNCSIMITSTSYSAEQLKEQIFNKKLLNDIILKAKKVYQDEHNIAANRKRFENECLSLIGRKK